MQARRHPAHAAGLGSRVGLVEDDKQLGAVAAGVVLQAGQKGAGTGRRFEDQASACRSFRSAQAWSVAPCDDAQAKQAKQAEQDWQGVMAALQHPQLQTHSMKSCDRRLARTWTCMRPWG